ncbi:hypothetical protein K7432_016773 [Basidiobolus ranarum]|uniref:Cysteine dioxygenase n=1 Tax=Basidiobolus ranarum TaxID=34480 RepID=A0ABR2WEA8_9FUNG
MAPVSSDTKVNSLTQKDCLMPKTCKVREIKPLETGFLDVEDSKNLAIVEHYTKYELPIKGQGTISFTFSPTGPFRIVLNSTTKQSRGKSPVIVLEVGENMALIRNRNDNEAASIVHRETNPEAFLFPGRTESFWLSFNKKNRQVRYGKGFMTPYLCLLTATLTSTDTTTGKAYDWGQIKNVAFCSTNGIGSQTLKPDMIEHHLWPLPVTQDLAPIIIQHDQVTLDDIANNTSTVIGNLPPVCQRLYANVAGPSISLNTKYFPDMDKAINHSIITPKSICYEMLKSKAIKALRKELGDKIPDDHDPSNSDSPHHTSYLEKYKLTYLRVTLGEDQGDSPGAPFVLEIWPGGHESPIHSHSKCYAIIKVLHGEISCQYFAGLKPWLRNYYKQAKLVEGQVTWLSPELYQTHRLVNQSPPGSMCATIQCYGYGPEDTEHYEKFDSVDYITGEISGFAPSSDWLFLTFKKQLLEEWEAHKAIQGKSN